MIYLVAGILLWTTAHLFQSVFSKQRARIAEANLDPLDLAPANLDPFKGIVALAIILSIILMVLGWKRTEPTYLYFPPYPLRQLLMMMVIIGGVLFFVSGLKTRIKQYVRHPQLVGFFIWALAHSILNGDSRSLILFPSLGIWALAEIFFINRRDGEWVKPEYIPSWKEEIRTIIVVVVPIVLILLFHGHLSGVPLV